jgi:hypothetical protein
MGVKKDETKIILYPHVQLWRLLMSYADISCGMENLKTTRGSLNIAL